MSSGTPIYDTTHVSRRAVLVGAVSTGMLVLLDRLGPAPAFAGQPAFTNADRSSQSFPLLVVSSLNTPLGEETPFGRVRAIDDETRVELDISATTNTTITATILSQPASYGIDYSQLSKKNQSIPANAMAQLQQLFEDTPLSFIGVYLAPSPNHPNTDWMKTAAELTTQGWALVPFYLGHQQDEADTHALAHIQPAHAAAQGKADGAQAASLAKQIDLPANATLWLDMENSGSFQSSTLTYIDAWRTAVANQNYQAGVYVLSTVAKQLHDHGDAIPLWVTRSWYSTASRAVLDDNLDIGGYCEIVPHGAQQSMREPVQLAKPADVPTSGSASKNWEFVDYAQTVGWQYRTDWPGETPHVIPSWTDTGVRKDFPLIINAVDLNLSPDPDPSHTIGGAKKTDRRRTVTAVTVNPVTVKAGSTTKLTVTLDQAVAADADLVVVVRSDLPELLAPTHITIPAGAKTASIDILTVPAPAAVSGTVTARSVHQLTGTVPSAKVTVSAT